MGEGVEKLDHYVERMKNREQRVEQLLHLMLARDWGALLEAVGPTGLRIATPGGEERIISFFDSSDFDPDLNPQGHTVLEIALARTELMDRVVESCLEILANP